MKYMKYKDEIPKKTIENIQTIFLNKLGIDFQIMLHKRITGVYSANIIDSVGDWSTCGKGTNDEYCLASGLGEAIEHFCNYNAFDYSLINEENKTVLGFKRYFDEERHNIESIKYQNPDVFDDMISTFIAPLNNKIDERDVIRCWEEFFESKQTLFVPYFDVRNKEVKLLPEQILDILCGSNGGGAGNTNEEAIGHALDELVERFVKYKIYHDKLTPPNINQEYIKFISNDLYRLIENIKIKCDCDIFVKDASLGKGFSALCVLMIDKNTHSYLVNFGAHPKFEIALERCITEMFQAYEKGNKIQRKNMQIWDPFIDDISCSINNWTSLLRDDVGVVPNEFFYTKPSWEFKPWQEFNEYNNKIGLHYQMNKFLDNGYNVYIRNNSFLGFPVFSVYIPKVSLNHIPFNEKQLKFLNLAKKIQHVIIEKEPLSNDLLNEAKSLFLNDTLFGQLLLRKMGSQDLILLQASILFDRKNILKSIEKLNHINNDKSRILKNFFKLSEKMDYDSAIALMSNFYSQQELDFLKNWQQGRTFKNLFLEMIKKENYSIDIKKQKYLNQLYLKYKNIQLNNTISQYIKL